MLLSQERVAAMSGLSLRTVQRLEAGHRVSYASLRALAAAFEADVDLLERELYAVNHAKQEFVEIPRWIRLLQPGWYGGPGLGRRDVLVVEALCVLGAVTLFACSFLFAREARSDGVRAGAFLLLFCGYLASANVRIGDKYELWPGSENAPAEKPRTWRSIAAEYAFMFGAGLLPVVLFLWLAF